MPLFACCVPDAPGADEFVTDMDPGTAQDTVADVLEFMSERIESLTKVFNEEKKGLVKMYQQYQAMCEAEKKAKKTKSDKDKKDYESKQQKLVDMICKTSLGWFVKYVAKDMVSEDLWDAGFGAIVGDEKVQGALVDWLGDVRSKKKQEKMKDSLKKVAPEATKELLNALAQCARKGLLKVLRQRLQQHHPYEEADKDINDDLPKADEIETEIEDRKGKDHQHHHTEVLEVDCHDPNSLDMLVKMGAHGMGSDGWSDNAHMPPLHDDQAHNCDDQADGYDQVEDLQPECE